MTAAAGIIDVLGNKEKSPRPYNPEHKSDQKAVETYVTPADQALIDETLEMRSTGIEYRRPHAAEVFRTLCFMYDYQNVVVDDRTLEIVTVKPRKKKRQVFDNRLRPTFNWLKSEYFKNLPVMTAHGAGEDLIDMASANVASKLAAYWRDKCGWLKAERKACNWVLAAGAAFIAPTWRKNPMSPTKVKRFEFNEEPVETYNPATDQYQYTYLQETEEETFNAGMAFDVYTTLQTFTFPLAAAEWDEVQEVVTVDLVTKEYVERYLGNRIKLEDLEEAEPEDLNLHQIERINHYVGSGFGLMKDRIGERRYILTQRRTRPSFDLPDGRYLVLINDQIIYKGPLPNIKEAREVDPLDSENLSMGIIPWFAYDQPGRLIPESPIAVLIPAQIQYNNLLTDQAINRHMLGRNKIFYKEGSFDEKEMTNAHAEMIKIKAGGELPEFKQGLHLSGIETEIQQAKQRFDEAGGRTPASQGHNPAQVRSAFQLDILIEKGQVPLEDRIRLREYHAQDVFWLACAIFRNHAPPEEVIGIYGPDRRHEIYAYLTCNFRHDLKVTEGSALPVNKASQEAKIVELLRYNLFNDENGMPDRDMVLDMLRLGKVDPKVNTRRLTRTMVENENFDMLNGVVILPFEHEDHALHAERHEAFLTRREFIEAPPDIKAILIFHLEEHHKMLAEAVSAEAAMLESNEQSDLRSDAIQGQTSPVSLPGLQPSSGLPGLE